MLRVESDVQTGARSQLQTGMHASVCAHCVLECGVRTGGVAAGVTPVGSARVSARVARARAAVSATEGQFARERRSA
eukprot:1668348-Pleurochrysis_carterae.AAC.1